MNIKEELSAFFHSIEYFSRIPKPGMVEYNSQSLSRGIRYFPIVGLLIGVLSVMVASVFNWFIPSMSLTILITMVVSVALSGALHEDGLADFVDGFGSSSEKEKILKVMKDSRIGSYGALGLVFTLMAKFLLLQEISTNLYNLLFYFVIAQIVSRSFAVLVTTDLEYVFIENSKANFVGVGKYFSNRFFAILILGVLSLLVSHGFSVITFIVMSTGFYFWFRSYIVKRIGGYTGDCLGFAQQVFEIIYYISVVKLLQS